MNYANSVIPYNESYVQMFDNIRQTLGLPIPTSGYNYFGVLATSPNINKWAQYKPVCGGFSARGRTGFTKDFQLGQDLLKTYQPPDGGERNIYSVRHFEGYKHMTVEPNVSLVGDGIVWIKPNGERSVMLRYLASGLNFKADGYNEIIIQQEMHGGGRKIVARKSLDLINLEAENDIDVVVSGEGLVVNTNYKRNLYVSFGTTGNPYIMVGEKLSHYRVTLDIRCTENGTMPPPPQQWGTIKMILEGAPTSIQSSVISPSFNFPYAEGDVGNTVRSISFPFSEEKIPTEADKNTFKKGTIRLFRKIDNNWVSKGLPTTYIQEYSPANGVSFARQANGQIVEFRVDRPIGSDVYEYKAVWSLY